MGIVEFEEDMGGELAIYIAKHLNKCCLSAFIRFSGVAPSLSRQTARPNMTQDDVRRESQIIMISALSFVAICGVIAFATKHPEDSIKLPPWLEGKKMGLSSDPIIRQPPTEPNY
eukprot:g76288.t1